jgi:hypothetical protein
MLPGVFWPHGPWILWRSGSSINISLFLTAMEPSGSKVSQPFDSVIHTAIPHDLILDRGAEKNCQMDRIMPVKVQYCLFPCQ